MLSTLESLTPSFPEIKINGEYLKVLKLLRFKQNPARYAGMAICLSFLVGLIVATFTIIYDVDGPLYGLLVFALCFAFFLLIPKMELKKRTTEMEVKLPLFLRTVGIYMKLGIPFVSSLEKAAESDGVLETEINYALGQVRNGISVQKAFSQMAQAYKSLLIKRAISQLLISYNLGTSGEELLRLGDEIISLERHKIKEYSSKSAIFGLVFIITSAIFPTFFIVYATFGKFAWNVNIDNTQIAVVMLTFFPLINILLLTVTKSMMPPSVFTNNNVIEPKLFIAPLLFVCAFVVPIEILQFPIIIIALAISIYMTYTTYKFESRVEKIEENLPDGLFAVSALPKSGNSERVFEIIENGGYGPLSEEAAKSKRQYTMNLKTEAIIDDLANRNQSLMLKRTCMVLKQMIIANSLDKISILAEDLLIAFAMKRERGQIFSMQKYTLLFGAVLIPLIMKIALSLLFTMSDLFGGANVAQTLTYTAKVIPPYLIIYSIISSSAIADAEGKKSSAALYFVVMSVLALLTFYLVSL